MEVLDSLFQACVEQLPVDMDRISSRCCTVVHGSIVPLGIESPLREKSKSRRKKLKYGSEIGDRIERRKNWGTSWQDWRIEYLYHGCAIPVITPFTVLLY
jgi:hypothetical protein